MRKWGTEHKAETEDRRKEAGNNTVHPGSLFRCILQQSRASDLR